MRLLTVALLSTVLLTACGSDDEAGAPPAAESASGVEPGALPVTIEHRFGETTVEEAPERIVVAGLRPDLILAVYSGLTKKDYDTLSKIAPTIAQPPGQVDWGSSWQDEILTVGRAVGRPAQAEKLRDEAEAMLTAAAEEHPEFQGQTGAVATPYQGIWVYGPHDARSRLLVDLGFTFPEELEDVGGDDFGGQLSGEKLDLLDVGAPIWFANPAPAEKVRDNKVYKRLPVRTEGRDIFLPEDGDLYEATSFISVLSIPLLVDELVPKLAAAADGDPATTTG